MIMNDIQIILICLPLLGYSVLYRYTKKEEKGALKLTDGTHIFIGLVVLAISISFSSLIREKFFVSSEENKEVEGNFQESYPSNPKTLPSNEPKIGNNEYIDELNIVQYLSKESGYLEEIKLEFSSTEMIFYYSAKSNPWKTIEDIDYQDSPEKGFKVRFVNGDTYKIRTQGDRLYSTGPIPRSNRVQTYTKTK